MAKIITRKEFNGAFNDKCFKVICPNYLMINWSIIMRFYSNSTGEEAGSISQNLCVPNFTTSMASPKRTQRSPPSYSYSLNQYCSQLLQLSNSLCAQLLKNSSLINMRLQYEDVRIPSQSQNKKDSENASTASRINSLQFEAQRCSSPKHSNKKRKRKISYSDSEEQYRLEDQYSKEQGESKVNESKNIPKNYGKAIVNFIRKNQSYTNKVLDHLNIDREDFMYSLSCLKSKINTIYQLRSLWLDKQNKYAKAYRIFSIQYLRKCSLPYIFNSRVQNFHKHIKYRYKIIKSVGNPEEFTCMKQF